MLKLLRHSHSLLHQSIEIVRRVAIIQHATEGRVGIRLAPISAQGFLIIHPGENQDLCVTVEPVKQPILLKKLCSKPVLSAVSKLPTLLLA